MKKKEKGRNMRIKIYKNETRQKIIENKPEIVGDCRFYVGQFLGKGEKHFRNC